MALENEVAALVTSTTALQGTVGAELAKVRAENTTFQATVVSKSGGTMTGTLTVPSIASTDQAIINGLSLGRGITNNISNSIVGEGAGTNLAGGSGLTVFGKSALSGGNTSSWNTAIGRLALGFNTTGAENTALGNGASTLNTTGSWNTTVGFHSLYANTTGYSNTAMGHLALTATTLGYSNTCIGYGSGTANTTGNSNTGVGNSTLYSNTTGSSNTAVGYSALTSGAAYSNTSALGASADVTGNNQVQLGNSATNVYCYNSVQNRSDKRDKADIRPTLLGLNFIKALNPVDYRWDMRDSYKPPMPGSISSDASENEKQEYQNLLTKWQEAVNFQNLKSDGSKKKNRYHHGLIAQEVEALIKASGQDFGGFQDHKRSGGQDVLSIGYDELIAPLIKAVQELAQANEDLRSRITLLEAGK